MPGFGSTRWAAGGAGLVGLAAGAVLAAGSLGPACANLPDIQQGQCGNGIVEQNEDCDGIGVALDGGPSAAGNTCSAACQVLCNVPPDGGADAGAGAGPACPWGWGCGTDGVCRRPAGTFTATAIQINEGVEHLLLGDVNGDGKKEIVVDTGAQLDVHYVDRDDTVEQTISLTVAQPTPAVGDFDGDGIDDIAYRLGSSFAVRHGATDQSLDALPFAIDLPAATMNNVDLRIPADARLIAVDVPAISAGQFKLKELLRLNPESVTVLLPSTGAATVAQAVLAPVGSNELATNAAVPAGYWDEGAGCEQFLLANKAAHDLEIYYTCAAGGAGWNDAVKGTKPIILGLPTGLQPAGPAWNLDVDGDGHRDLVVYLTDPLGAHGQIQVAYGNGAGAFSSTPPKTAWTPDPPTSTLLCLGDADANYPPTPLDPLACTRPLALADLDGDGTLDVVNPCGIYLSTLTGTQSCTAKSPTTHLTAAVSSQSGVAGALWTVASIADLNGDGIPDVVAASCADTSITYLENAGSASGGSSGGPDGGPSGGPSTYFNPFVIPTVGGIDELAVGDFDGDLVPDILYAERSGSSLVCDTTTTFSPAAVASLAAVFGGRSGGPQGPVLVTKDIGTINQIAAHNLNATIGQDTSTTDLAVLLTNPAETTHQFLYVFQGSTDREILAPYFMVDPLSQLIDTPLLISMGKFAGDPGTGVAVLAAERPMSSSLAAFANLWALHQANGSLEGQPSGAVPIPIPAGGDPGQYLQYEGNLGAWATSLDLGGQAGDGVVGLTLDRTSAQSQLYLFSVTNGTLTLTSGSPVKLGAAYGGPLHPADVDADGHKDLILVEPGGALVLWNDGSGALDPTGGTAIPLSQLQAALGSDGKSCGYPTSVVAVTSIQSAVGLPLGVLLATDTGGYLASLDPASPSGHAFTVTCGTGVPGVPAHTLLVAGDVDGDGVDDVVVGAPGALQIFHGAPVNP